MSMSTLSLYVSSLIISLSRSLFFIFSPRLQIQEIQEVEEPTLIKWVRCSNGTLPDNAIEGGCDPDGMALYVARADHAGGKIPGKFSVASGKVYIPWNCVEHEKTEYEVNFQT